MCRGANLGTCCAQGCDDPITCQDTGGYCNAHDPMAWMDDEDGDARAPAPLVDDPEKRRTYTRSQLESGIRRLEAYISATQRQLDEMRDRLSDLT